jgi:hypothetical protein
MKDVKLTAQELESFPGEAKWAFFIDGEYVQQRGCKTKTAALMDGHRYIDSPDFKNKNKPTSNVELLPSLAGVIQYEFQILVNETIARNKKK